MRLLIAILLICSAVANVDTPLTYNLEGTVGNHRIVMFIVSGDGKTWGRCFLKDDPISVTISGSKTGDRESLDGIKMKTFGERELLGVPDALR